MSRTAGAPATPDAVAELSASAVWWSTRRQSSDRARHPTIVKVEQTGMRGCACQSNVPLRQVKRGFRLPITGGMRLVATNRLKPGMLLGRDVLTDVHGRVPLLRAGIPINERYRQALLDGGINAVYVDDELGSGIKVTQALSESTRESATKALVRSFSGAPTMLEKNETLSDVAIKDLADVAARISADLADADDAVLALSDLAAADRYTLQPSIDVTAIGVLIARRPFRFHGRPASSGPPPFAHIEQ